MNFVRYLMPILLAAGFTAGALQAQQQQETSFEKQLQESDDQPVREFVQSKENIDIKKKANNLDISGDIRFEWRNLYEKGVVLYTPCDSSTFDDNGEGASSCPIRESYRNIRGGHHVDARDLPVSHNDFDVEFNLKLKYSFGRSWATAHLQYDNSAGVRGRNDCCVNNFPIFDCNGDEVVDRAFRDQRRTGKGSGEGNSINLKRAFMGYNIWADGKNRLDIEAGRRKLDDVFVSEIQFSNRFDGILLKYARSINEDMDFYWENGVFVIDERVNLFGYATEIGLLNVYDLGLDVRYSFIDWTKHGKNRCHIRNPFGSQFQISQLSFVYTINPEFDCKVVPFEFYGGVLINHAAKKTRFTHHKRKNLGAYAGLTVGVVNKAGDWAIDVEYNMLQAQAVADIDAGGICRGNFLEDNLYDIVDVSVDNAPSYNFSSYSPGECFSSKTNVYLPRRGNTNYQGWRFEFLYAFTDNLTIDTIYEYSREEDRHIGGPHRYSDFEIEFIYAF
jgi:hypothetical protein